MPKNAKVSELTVSRTQILEYLKCGYRWDLGYRRGIASTSLSEKMDLGSAAHMGIKYAIQRYAIGAKVAKDWPAVQRGVKQWAKETRERLGVYLTDQHEEEIRCIEHDAIDIAVKGLESVDLPKWEVAKWNGKPVCEMEFVTPLPPWKGYRTIPDLVARLRSDGKKAPWWLIDWKTRGTFESDDAEEINLQFSTMQYVLELETNLEIEGSLLWQIKAQAPRKPDRNKDGKMSRAAIVTDWPTYEAALREASLDPADYADMKEKIGLVEWFRTIKQHRTMEECEAWWNEVVVPAAKAMHTNPQIIRASVHLPFACAGCWARQFCLAEIRNDDTEYLLSTDYMDTRNPRSVLETGSARRQFNLT